ncbi:MAG: DotU family type IV/VI secretion system protein [Planctomycetia bacterium]|nr:DotU family type IV/VI secretion system protein [Planctomycetia bacterium]
MQDKYARVVHEVMGHALDLKSRLQKGENPSMQVEQQRFIQMLTGHGELNQDPQYIGDGINNRITNTSNKAMEPFLGIRYALACWLDEIFIASDSTWTSAWTESTLEMILYGGAHQRAWRFWNNMIKAQARSGSDALEVHLWCVLLGFRGEPGEAGITDVHRFINTVRTGVLTGMPREFPLPTEREPHSNVPALRNRERYGMMLRILFTIILICLGTAVFLFLQRWSN